MYCPEVSEQVGKHGFQLQDAGQLHQNAGQLNKMWDSWNIMQITLTYLEGDAIYHLCSIYVQ